MPYKAETLLGNWFEQRLEPVNAESFSGIQLPTGYAHSYRTSYAEMTKLIACSAPPAKFIPPSENWLAGGSDPLTASERYESVNAAMFKSPENLEEYRKKWTHN